MEADKIPITNEYARPGNKNIKNAKIALITPMSPIAGSVFSGLFWCSVILAAMTMPNMNPPTTVGIRKFPAMVRNRRILICFLPNVRSAPTGAIERRLR
jgi:hypothetical protein